MVKHLLEEEAVILHVAMGGHGGGASAVLRSPATSGFHVKEPKPSRFPSFPFYNKEQMTLRELKLGARPVPKMEHIITPLLQRLQSPCNGVLNSKGRKSHWRPLWSESLFHRAECSASCMGHTQQTLANRYYAHFLRWQHQLAI